MIIRCLILRITSSVLLILSIQARDANAVLNSSKKSSTGCMIRKIPSFPNSFPFRTFASTAFIKTSRIQTISSEVMQSITEVRGGFKDLENTSEDGSIEYDDEEESEEEEEFFDAVQEQTSDESEESDAEALQSEISTEGIKIEVNVNKFDEPFVQSPMTGLMVSIGVLYLSRKIDLFSPHCVRAARWGFVCYLVLLQAFVCYFRIQAKKQNNRTPIDLQNPLFTILQNKFSPQTQDKSNDVVKNIASSFLSNKTTVLEYDLQQTRSMQSGILFSILFQWVLHFKFEQIQPLIMATLNGLLALVYSPLFQVYILGKNLERPFKFPALTRSPIDSPSAPLAENHHDFSSTSEGANVDDSGECDEDETYNENLIHDSGDASVEEAIEDEE